MANTLFPLQVSPTIPSPLRRLADLAQNFLFSWYPTTGQLFRKLDSVLWRKVEGNPKLFLRCVDQGILERAADDRTVPRRRTTRVLADFDRYLRKSRCTELDELAATTWSRISARSSGCTRAFRSIRAASACSRATTARPRATWLAVRRGGAALPPGLFQPAHRPQRPTGARVSADRSAQHAALGRARRRPAEELRVKCPFAERAVRSRVWKAASAACLLLLLDTDVEENSPRTAGSRTCCTAATESAAAAGGRARRRRRARDAGARARADRVAHQRGPCGLLRARAPARVHAAGLAVRGGARGDGREHGVHDAHARERGHDVFPPDRVAHQFESYPAAARHQRRRAARPRPLRRAARRVQHDAARDPRLGAPSTA